MPKNPQTNGPLDIKVDLDVIDIVEVNEPEVRGYPIFQLIIHGCRLYPLHFTSIMMDIFVFIFKTITLVFLAFSLSLHCRCILP